MAGKITKKQIDAAEAADQKTVRDNISEAKKKGFFFKKEGKNAESSAVDRMLFEKKVKARKGRLDTEVEMAAKDTKKRKTKSGLRKRNF